jgi:cell division protein FtsB
MSRLGGPWRVLAAPAAALVAALAVLLADGRTGVLALREVRESCAGADRRILELEAEREGLIAEIEALRGEPLAVETAARERLGMVREGEIVLRWELPAASD